MADISARLIAEHMMSREGAAPAWGLVLEEARAGYARVSMALRPDMLNGFGGAHGGMIFALADAAFAYACNSHNVATVAAQASIVFLASPKAGDVLVAEAREEALAGRSGVYAVAVRTREGVNIARFQGLSRTIGGAVLGTADRDAD